MKSSDKPEFSAKWWMSKKPEDVEGADLEGALEEMVSALSANKRSGDKESIEACLEALDELSAAVDKTISKECDRKQHKDVVTVLKKYDGLIQTEAKRLQDDLEELEQGEEAEDDEEDPSDDKLFERKYLEKCIKRLRKKPMQFGFGLGSQPENCVLVLKKKGRPQQLLQIIRREKSLRKVTFGIARADDNDPKTMVFELEGKQLPNLKKKGREFLRAQKLRPFRDLRLIVDGQDAEDVTEEE
jgi:hypothetical protein